MGAKVATVEVAVDTEEEDLPQGEDMAVATAVAAGKFIFVFFLFIPILFCYDLHIQYYLM